MISVIGVITLPVYHEPLDRQLADWGKNDKASFGDAIDIFKQGRRYGLFDTKNFWIATPPKFNIGGSR